MTSRSQHPAAAEEAGAARHRSLWLGAFGLLVAVQLVPIWAAPSFPSQDGPVHLATAHILLHSGEPPNDAFFDVEWTLADSNFSALALMGLLQLAPATVAEKLLVSGYAVLLPLSALGALRAAGGAALPAAFLVLPFVYARVLLLGFYAFAWGMVVFFVAVGATLRLLADPSPRRAALLALVLAIAYAVHPFAAAAALLFAGTRVAAGALLAGRPRDRRLWLVLAAGAPVVVGVVWFLVSNPPGVVWAGPAEKASRVLQLSALVSHGDGDRVVAGATALLFLGLVVAAARRGGASPHRELLAVVLVFFGVLALVPLRLGEAGHLVERFAPFAFFALALWLSVRIHSSAVWRVACAGVAVLVLLGTAERVRVFRLFGEELSEYAASAEQIPTGATVLALHFDDFHVWPGGFGPTWRRADPFLHAVATVTRERDAVNLRSYQALKGYFPLAFRPERNPIRRISRTPGRPAGILQHPMSASPLRYEEATGIPVDVVLVWGSRERPPGGEDERATLAEVEGAYREVFASPGRGRMRVFRR